MCRVLKETQAPLHVGGGENKNLPAAADEEAVEACVGPLLAGLNASREVLAAALADKVIQVYGAGVRLLRRVASITQDVASLSKRTSPMVVRDMVQALGAPLASVVSRIGDAKTKVSTLSCEAVAALAAHSGIGAVFVCNALLHAERGAVTAGASAGAGDSAATGRKAQHAAGVEGRLALLRRLAMEHGINADRATANDGPGLPLQRWCTTATATACVCGVSCYCGNSHFVSSGCIRLLSAAVAALNDREARARQAAMLLLYTCHRAGERGGYAPIVAQAIARLPSATRDRIAEVRTRGMPCWCVWCSLHSRSTPCLRCVVCPGSD